MSIQYTKLPSGLRIITDTVKAVDSVALGIWAGVGTRDENMLHNGVAHMVEHMLFKGTERRDSLQIVEEIESVGGSMNAYTSREVTAYHIHLLKEHTKLAVDVLADMVQHSVMHEEEVERERHVILQEIGMGQDTPDDLVFDYYQETAYPNQVLGAPILGTADIIKNMQRDVLMGYVADKYTAQNLVFSAAGNIDHDEFVKMVEDAFGDLPQGTVKPPVNADYKGGEHREDKDLEQVHLVLGFQGVSRLDDDFYATVALSAIMGSGMSSRLFQEIREKRGLVYSVFAFHSPYQDDGQFVVYAGTGEKDVAELMPVLCDEIGKATHTMTDDELDRAKARLRSSSLMAQESMKSRAGQNAKHLIFHDEVLDIHKRLEILNEVTVDDVHGAAKRIFSKPPTLAALGPLSSLEPFDNIKSKLAA